MNREISFDSPIIHIFIIQYKCQTYFQTWWKVTGIINMTQVRTPPPSPPPPFLSFSFPVILNRKCTVLSDLCVGLLSVPMIGCNWRVVHPSSIKETGIMWLFRGIKLSALLFLNQTQSYPPGYPSPYNNMFVLRGAFPAKNLFWYSNPYPSLVGSWRGCWFWFFGWGGDFFQTSQVWLKSSRRKPCTELFLAPDLSVFIWGRTFLEKQAFCSDHCCL